MVEKLSESACTAKKKKRKVLPVRCEDNNRHQIASDLPVLDVAHGHQMEARGNVWRVCVVFSL